MIRVKDAQVDALADALAELRHGPDLRVASADRAGRIVISTHHRRIYVEPDGTRKG